MTSSAMISNGFVGSIGFLQARLDRKWKRLQDKCTRIRLFRLWASGSGRNWNACQPTLAKVANPEDLWCLKTRNRGLCWSHDAGVSLRKQANVGMRAAEVVGKDWRARTGFGGRRRVSAGGDGRRRAPDCDGRLTACGPVDCGAPAGGQAARMAAVNVVAGAGGRSRAGDGGGGGRRAMCDGWQRMARHEVRWRSAESSGRGRARASFARWSVVGWWRAAGPVARCAHMCTVALV